MTLRQGPILFCATHSIGEANTSLALAGELARRGVPNLWFAGEENHRRAVAGTTEWWLHPSPPPLDASFRRCLPGS